MSMKRAYQCIIGFGGLVLALQAIAASANGVTLKSIQTTNLSGGHIQVELNLSGPAPKPLTFSVHNPAMIVLDLKNTRLSLPSNDQRIGKGNLVSIQAAEARHRSRVVLNLGSMTPYRTVVHGNHIFVMLGAKTGEMVASEKKAMHPKGAGSTFGPASGRSHSRSNQSARRITAIHFHRTQEGAGRVVIGLGNPDMVGTVNQEGSKVIVRFKNTRLPKHLQESLNVVDFATPVTAITAQQRGHNARIVIKGTGQFDQMAFQANKMFAVELKPQQTGPSPTGLKKVYTGKRLTLNFQSIPVRAVLQILADFTGKNMVVSGAVTGNITLRLHDVPWDEALAIILQTQGLEMHKQGDVLMIAPAAEFAKQEQAQMQAKDQMQQLSPLHTAYIQINYAKAQNLAKLIKSQKSSLLSSRGKVTVDPRTNTLIVRDTDSHIAQVRKLVRILDVPVRQVLISSRIVIATNDFNRELGVKFGFSGLHQGQNSVIAVDGSAVGNNNMLSSVTNSQGSGSSGTGGTASTSGTFQFPSLDNRLNVNVPVQNPVGRFAVAILNQNYLTDLELSALQAEGKGEVISSPRVITANQQQAEIEQGVEIPYENSSASGATAVQFKKAVLSLKVTPQITPDNRILMNIEVHKDNVGSYVPTANGGQVPSINTRTVTTKVLVNNGDTVVLGGIYEITKNHSVNKVPILGDIPLLGFLFRNTQVTNNKSELLIFVTPKILSKDLSD